MTKKLDEASININGADASEVADILRMMQLAGAPGAKTVDADDINPGPKPCPICGKVHGPSQPMGGCGAEPKGPDGPEMGDMIRMMAPEEEEMDGEFQDASTAPDEEYGAMDDMIRNGDDIHKSKNTYAPTNGGDNPMNLESELKQRLMKALSEKKAKPDYIDIDGDGDKKEPMKKAVKDKEKKHNEETRDEKKARYKQARADKRVGDKMDKDAEITSPAMKKKKKVQNDLLKMAGIKK